MKDIILTVENVSKQYRLGQVGTGTLSHDLNRWWHKVIGKENPYLKIGEENDRSHNGNNEYVWVVQDINFVLARGEILGIIGKNGAGKSTLLKLLSKITTPTSGSIKYNGKITSLLEVGTGFHPELTGRENIYLNGAILGMTKNEITTKIEEIIDFSGVKRYIDTPVKRYSSGMYVRLAFAVAAHLDSDILIVDEVLAVGDAEFQEKCIGKIKDIANEIGRTVIFVSHNMAAVKTLCTTGIVLEKGKVVFEGNIHSSIEYYLQSNKNEDHTGLYVNEALAGSGFVSISVVDKNNHIKTQFEFDDPIFISVKIKVAERYLKAYLTFTVLDKNESIIFISEINLATKIEVAGVYQFVVEIPKKLLLPNKFKLTFGMHIPNIEMIDHLEKCVSFEILETGSKFYIYGGLDCGYVSVDCNWNLIA